MLRDERELLLNEKEIKPNRFTAKALLVFAPLNLGCLILNELGIYRIEINLMRFSAVVGILACILPTLLVHNKKLVAKPQCKYILILLTILTTFISTVTLNFHVTLLLLFPLLMVTEHRSMKLFWTALGGSLFCTVISPVIGYLIGTWDPALFEMLYYFSSHQHIASASVTKYNIGADLLNITIYLIVPKFLIVLGFSFVIYVVMKKGISEIESRLQIIHLNQTDVLTDLMNRNMYETRLYEYEEGFEESVTCLFADADGLHELNNEKGHAAGDELLKTVAGILKEHFDREDVYRIGGDEFVAFVRDVSLEEIQKRVEEIRTKIIARGYHVSVGYAQMKEGILQETVRQAEVAMYKEKKNYYETIGNRRFRGYMMAEENT